MKAATYARVTASRIEPAALARGAAKSRSSVKARKTTEEESQGAHRAQATKRRHVTNLLAVTGYGPYVLSESRKHWELGSGSSLQYKTS